jgi:hypothetical protein
MPAGNTYEAIATNTVSGSSTTTVTFSSIPQTYTDLVLVMSVRASAVTFNNMNFMNTTLNSDTSAIYSPTFLYYRNTGGGASAISSRGTNENNFNLGGIATNNFGSSIFSTYTINFMNYSNTTTNKTVLARIATGGDLTAMDDAWAAVGLYRSTSAISTISVSPSSSGNFVAGSTFSLYGIKAA